MKMDKASTRASACLLAIFAVALALISRQAIMAMFESWQKDEYSHGYMIPLLSFVLMLNQMHGAKLKPSASWLGAALVTSGILLQFGFQFAGVYGLLPQFFLFSVLGLIALFFGMTSLRILAGSLGLLFFCAPLPKFLYYTLSFNMQMLSSSLGTNVLTLLGYSVFQDGNIIDLGGYKLQVAEACNGLRYLFPLMGLSFLLALMFKAPFWKRALLFFSALPVSVLMNGLRIAFIGVTVDRWGSSMAEGTLHEVEGWMVFVGCIATLLLEVALLQKIGGKNELDFGMLRIPSLQGLPTPALGKPTAFNAVVLALGLAVSLALPSFLDGYLKSVPMQRPLSQFPLQLGEWIGHQGTLDAKSLDVLGTPDYFIADYTKKGEPPINLYTLYYAQQDSTSNQVVHSPAVCIPGGGWEIVSKTTQELSLKDSTQLAVNRLLVTKGTDRALVYFWYVQNGFETASPNASKIHAFKSAFAKGQTNGAIIRVYTPILAGTSEQDAEQRMLVFLNESDQRLMNYMF